MYLRNRILKWKQICNFFHISSAWGCKASHILVLVLKSGSFNSRIKFKLLEHIFFLRHWRSSRVYYVLKTSFATFQPLISRLSKPSFFSKKNFCTHFFLIPFSKPYIVILDSPADDFSTLPSFEKLPVLDVGNKVKGTPENSYLYYI